MIIGVRYYCKSSGREAATSRSRSICQLEAGIHQPGSAEITGYSRLKLGVENRWVVLATDKRDSYHI